MLLACSWGSADDVVTLTKEETEAGVAVGELDIHPDAVAYAKSAAAAKAEH